MKIWVRLIGGPNNGEVAKVDDDQPYLDKAKPTPLLAMRSHCQFGLTQSTVSVVHTRYTRRTVTTPGGVIIFFALADLSDFEALNQMLGP